MRARLTSSFPAGSLGSVLLGCTLDYFKRLRVPLKEAKSVASAFLFLDRFQLMSPKEAYQGPSDEKHEDEVTGVPSYEEAAVNIGAPVEGISPLGYHVGPISVVFLVRLLQSHLPPFFTFDCHRASAG